MLRQTCHAGAITTQRGNAVCYTLGLHMVESLSAHEGVNLLHHESGLMVIIMHYATTLFRTDDHHHA
jgi:hypothetical protein